ncbi:MAG: alpha-L-rhamnosidase C-terminal domain-containing protein [Bryobacteraceae bacterium]
MKRKAAGSFSRRAFVAGTASGLGAAGPPAQSSSASEEVRREEHPFRHSAWIGCHWQDDCGGEPGARFYAFRNNVALAAAPAKAPIRITADSRYILWVNGVLVGRGPARCFPEKQSYDEYDIGAHLHAGTNWLAILVHQFGVSNGQYLHRARTGVILEGVAEMPSGEKVTLRTDLSWQVRVADWIETGQARLSQHMGCQERYVAGAEPPDWRMPSDSAADKTWVKPFYLGPPGCAPWTGFEPRGLAPMHEEPVRPEAVRWAIEGRNPEDIGHAANLLSLWPAAGFSRINVPQPDADGWVQAAPRESGFVALAFDFGWNHAAYARVDVRGAAGGAIIDSYYAAGFNDAGDPVPLTGFGRPYEGVADRMTVQAGDSAWESYTIRGYRHHVVVIRSNRPLQIRVTALRTHHAVLPNAFESSDEVINGVWRVSDLTLRAGMLDAFVDNNSREQCQWIHDGCVAAMGSWATYGETALWKRGLRQWGDRSFPSSSLYSVAPMDPTFMGILDYTCVWMRSLWEYYEVTLDAATLRECLPALERFVRTLVMRNITSEGLFIQPEGVWIFLDWSALDKRPYSLTLNLMMLRALESAVHVVSICGDTKLAADCAGLAARIRGAIAARFWSHAHRAWLEHIDPSEAVRRTLAARLPDADKDPWQWTAAEPRPLCASHGNALAVLLKLGSPGQQATAAQLVARSLVPGQTEVNRLSPLWTDKIFAALFESGHEKEAVQAFHDWHGKWIAAGAVGWGENWEASANTHTQTCGASANWILSRYILGIQPLKPGFAAAVFQPRPGSITWAEGTVPTLHGNIHVSWKLGGDGRIISDIKAPSGVQISTKNLKQTER